MPRGLATAFAIVLSAAFGGVLLAQAQRHIETDVALSHLVKKVEPEMPAEAVKAKVGGSVVADVTIDARGAVTEITILSGEPILHAAAERALRQWTFKPFLVNGKPDVVRVILGVDFPDLARDEQEHASDEYHWALDACRRQIERQAPDAEEACAAAVRKADALPRYYVSERDQALAAHAHSLFLAGRTRDAIAELERYCEMQATRPGRGGDPDTANAHQTLALLHQQLGEDDKADAEFAAAIAAYARAIDSLPAFAFQAAPGLRAALLRYAALKRARGDVAGAAALEARAAPLGSEPQPPKRPMPKTRTVGNMQVTGTESEGLTDDDLQQIRSLLAGPREVAWRLDVRHASSGASAGRSVRAYLAPAVVTASFRSGQIVEMSNLPPPGQPSKHTWQRFNVRPPSHYLQVAAAGAEAAAAEPIEIDGDASIGLPSDEDLVAIIQSIRDRTVATANGQTPSVIHSWPINRISVAQGGELYVHLANPVIDLAHPDPDGFAQLLRMRKSDGRWTVTRIEGAPPRGKQ